jgi:hypothetical protein
MRVGVEQSSLNVLYASFQNSKFRFLRHEFLGMKCVIDKETSQGNRLIDIYKLMVVGVQTD